MLRKFLRVTAVATRTVHSVWNSSRGTILAIFGIFLGFTLTMCFQTLMLAIDTDSKCSRSMTPETFPNIPKFFLDGSSSEKRSQPVNSNMEASGSLPVREKGRKLVLVGVMTARKYLNSRAETINRTWARSIPGSVKYFVGTTPSDQISNTDLPLISLPVDDSAYPPQKKSFLMLKYMWEHYGEEFDWFVRADDDIYIRGDWLDRLLCSINASQALYIGQTGLGNKAEYGHLSLGDADNYCMGGTGMIFSRETLKRLAPYLKDCLQNLYTTHEDVEIGRCVRKYAQVSCTWAYEMQQIFQNNVAFNRSPAWFEIPDQSHVVTLHPIKNPRFMEGAHLHFKRIKSNDFRYRYVQIFRDFAFASRRTEKEAYRLVGALQDFATIPDLLLITSESDSSSDNDAIPIWHFLSPTLMYCSGQINCPRHSVPTHLKTALKNVQQEILHIINKNSRQKGRVLEFRELLYGYTYVSPLRGPMYILDMILLYKKFKGKRITAQVRRHAYVQQTFAHPEALLPQVTGPENPLLSGPPSPHDGATRLNGAQERVNIIIPLSGRFETFQKFLSTFQMVALESKENVSLTLVLREDSEDTLFAQQVQAELDALRAIYPLANMSVLTIDLPPKLGDFSRGFALARGAEIFLETDLLLLTDIDVTFTRFALYRVRFNTCFRRQVYFPVVFSEYAPRTKGGKDVAGDSYSRLMNNDYSYGEDRGYFRHFGFGIVAIYKGDLMTVGGYNLEIKGWGFEDVDLYDRIIKFDGQKSEIQNGANFTVLRAPDPGFVHIYHKIHCDNSSAQQYKMCLGSKASSFASQRSLANFFLRKRNSPNSHDFSKLLKVHTFA